MTQINPRKIIDPGAIGTKLGTFIIDDNVKVSHEHVSLHQYDKFLIDSINFGLKWLSKKSQEGKLDTRDLATIQKLQNDFKENNYTDNLNQRIIEVCYNIRSKLNKIIT